MRFWNLVLEHARKLRVRRLEGREIVTRGQGRCEIVGAWCAEGPVGGLSRADQRRCKYQRDPQAIERGGHKA
jgi:hypothetical protein